MIWFELISANALDGMRISLPAVPQRGNLVAIGGVNYQITNVLFIDSAAIIKLQIEAV